MIFHWPNHRTIPNIILNIENGNFSNSKPNFFPRNSCICGERKFFDIEGAGSCWCALWGCPRKPSSAEFCCLHMCCHGWARREILLNFPPFFAIHVYDFASVSDQMRRQFLFSDRRKKTRNKKSECNKLHFQLWHAFVRIWEIKQFFSPKPTWKLFVSF